MLIAAKAHCYDYLLHRFVEGIEHADAALKPILTKVATLYALYNLLEVVGTYALQSGYYTPTQFALIRSQVPIYCQIVREDANPLVDAFGLSDFIINSPLGRYDGDIYRHYFDKVKRARKLSKSDHFSFFVFVFVFVLKFLFEL
jgi:acyl-CoA oxidase